MGAVLSGSHVSRQILPGTPNPRQCCSDGIPSTCVRLGEQDRAHEAVGEVHGTARLLYGCSTVLTVLIPSPQSLRHAQAMEMIRFSLFDPKGDHVDINHTFKVRDAFIIIIIIIVTLPAQAGLWAEMLCQ